MRTPAGNAKQTRRQGRIPHSHGAVQAGLIAEPIATKIQNVSPGTRIANAKIVVMTTRLTTCKGSCKTRAQPSQDYNTLAQSMPIQWVVMVSGGAVIIAKLEHSEQIKHSVLQVTADQMQLI